MLQEVDFNYIFQSAMIIRRKARRVKEKNTFLLLSAFARIAAALRTTLLARNEHFLTDPLCY